MSDIPYEETSCECGRPNMEHTFREKITCLFEGTPLKDGGTFSRQTADEIVDNMTTKMERDFAPDGAANGIIQRLMTLGKTEAP